MGNLPTAAKDKPKGRALSHPSLGVAAHLLRLLFHPSLLVFHLEALLIYPALDLQLMSCIYDCARIIDLWRGRRTGIWRLEAKGEKRWLKPTNV